MSTIAADNIQLHANHTIQECQDNRKARSLRLRVAESRGTGDFKYNIYIHSTLGECYAKGGRTSMSVKSEEMKGLSWGRCSPAGAAAAVQLSNQVEGIASWEYSVPYQGSVDVVWPCKNIQRCSLLFRWMQPLPQHRMLSLTLLGSLLLAMHHSRSLSMRLRPFDVIQASSQSSRHISLHPRPCLLCTGSM